MALLGIVAGAWARAIGDGVDTTVSEGISVLVTDSRPLGGWDCGVDAGTGFIGTDAASGRAPAEVDCGSVNSAGVTAAGPAGGIAASGEESLPVVAGSDVGVSICWGIGTDMPMSGGGGRPGEMGMSDAPMNIPVRNTIDMK